MAAEIKEREFCPECTKVKGKEPSRKNLAVYRDGVFCLSCGFTEKHKQPIKEESKEIKEKIVEEKKEPSDLIPGKHSALEERGLTLETCQKYNIKVNQYTGFIAGEKVINKEVRIFPIYKDGKVIKQKLKAKHDKKLQTQVGETSSNNLFGQNLFTPTKNVPIIVTEGEEDAASAWQMMGYPAVSITRGSNGARKELTEHLEWLAGFKHVVLAFDNDEAGELAFQDCAIGLKGKPPLFEPGTCRKAVLSLKDVNEMLKKNKIEEFKKAIWNAEIIRPPTLVSVKEIRHLALIQPQWGREWPWKSLTKATYGMRTGEIYMVAGPTSAGKTEFIRCIISYLISNGSKVGYFSFEQLPQATIQRFVSGAINKRIYIPGTDWNEDEINREIDKIEDSIYLYNPASGHVNVDRIVVNIRFLHNCYGYKFFVVDNLKALSLVPIIDGKRVASYDYASHSMGILSMLCRQLDINIFVLNHLSEDKLQKQAYVSTSPKNPGEYLNRTAEDMNKFINKPGMEWETGRMPTIGNIWAGGMCKDLTDYIISLGRNRMSDCPEEHRTLRVKMLKTRLDSSYEGFEFRLKYNYETGNLDEDFSYLDKRSEDNTSSLHDNNDTASLE